MFVRDSVNHAFKLEIQKMEDDQVRDATAESSQVIDKQRMHTIEEHMIEQTLHSSREQSNDCTPKSSYRSAWHVYDYNQLSVPKNAQQSQNE